MTDHTMHTHYRCPTCDALQAENAHLRSRLKSSGCPGCARLRKAIQNLPTWVNHNLCGQTEPGGVLAEVYVYEALRDWAVDALKEADDAGKDGENHG